MCVGAGRAHGAPSIQRSDPEVLCDITSSLKSPSRKTRGQALGDLTWHFTLVHTWLKISCLMFVPPL